MLITEPSKSNNILQQIGSTSSTAIVSNSQAGANNSFSAVPPSTGTPLRSRHRQAASDDRGERNDNAPSKGKNPPKPPQEFYRDLQQFHERRGTPIRNIPRISGHEVDLHLLYSEVIERGGFLKVNSRDEWDEVLVELGWKEKIVNGSAGLKFIYRRFLEKYERVNFFGEDPDKIDAMEAADMAEIMGTAIGGGRGGRGTSRYPTSVFGTNASATIQSSVAMTYNYKQHHVNLEKRRQYKLSTDLHKSSPYEKLMLSLLSPLPNEQDFAINACTLMANESKHTLKINEYPKILDALLAHTGVFSDYTMRKLFQHVYNGVRRHSLYAFWYDLLHDRPQILELYTDEQAVREAAIVDDWDDGKQGVEEGIWYDSKEMDFLNLGRGLGTQDYVGQRVLQVIAILRNLSFIEENLGVLVKNKTLLRFLVMSSNIRWSNVHIQALEITGNIASELELMDPTIDALSRCLMSTICEGIDGPDRGVIINCLEILYKLCQKETNEDYILKCLSPKFYNTIALYLSLNDIMLLLFTLEAIYALTCLGSKSCNSMMQVRGIIDQLISLISVEAQSYGPDGCILMRVVETVPGNMLPMVAQNIANLQNVAVIQKSNVHPQMKAQMIPNPPMIMSDVVDSIPPLNGPNIVAAPVEQHTQPQPQLQMPQSFTYDDEQYALSWLGATFERAASSESHIEQQELYRMYLSHCQKSGKHSVVNHMHFPKLVRLLFTMSVGPAIIRKSDGTDLPGLHYVSIRMRAQPLPLQQKPTLVASGSNSPSVKQPDSPSPARKIKKKIKTEGNAPATPNAFGDNVTSAVVESEKPPIAQITKHPTATVKGEAAYDQENVKIPQQIETKCDEKMDLEEPEDDSMKPTEESIVPVPSPQLTETSSSAMDAPNSSLHANQSQSSQTSLIKSLLANKVNQRQQKQKDLTPTNTTASQPAAASTQPIKVASTAITSLVNNPLIQNTPVKVGQTTIKPLNPQLSLEKKHISESTPPPLAPLSGSNVAKDSSGRPILLANQMLVDILDKKMIEPPLPTGLVQKRKMDEHAAQDKRMAIDSPASAKEETAVTPSKNAANLYAEMAASILEDEDLEELSGQTQSNPIPTEPPMQQPSLIIPSKVQQTSNTPRQLMFQASQQPQIKLPHQTSSGPTAPQIPNAVATIKTDQGLQTVPVILHSKPLDTAQQHNQAQLIQQVIQPTTTQTQTQYVLATNQQGQTYLVAQQSQPQCPVPQPQPTQTVLVTQTPQQQSTGAKTIIILQQNPLSGPGPQQQIITTTQGQPQKMIMTTPQGQQVLVTQRPQTPQQIFINPQTGAATHIQHVPAQSRQIIQTTTAQALPPNQQQQSSQIQAGQISPSLLNQLNQIPATIKLHQPQAQQPSSAMTQQGPMSRVSMGKGGIPMAQGSTSTPTAPLAVPQLQQHQSIIQQHIISGPSEKRHVILGGGRAIEIKETVITQAQPPPQQCQLNSQTIITTQQATASASSSSPSSLLQQQQTQQVQQQIRAVLEQQQKHPSIIQQKISSFSVMPQQQQQTHQQQQHQTQSQIVLPTVVVTAAATMTSQAPTLIAAKIPEPTPSLIQSNKPPASTSTMMQSGATGIAASQTNNKKSLIGGGPPPPSLIKPSLPIVKLPTTINAGPPPLAAVNNSPIPTTTATGANVYQATQNTQPEKENRKDEALKASTPAASTQSVNQNTTTSTSSLAVSSSQPLNITSTTTSAVANNSSLPIPPTPQSLLPTPTQPPQLPQPVIPQISAADAQWLYICDWRNCPRKKFKSLSDLQYHVCTSHAPDHLDPSAEIFCQWGVSPGLCDGISRKRFSLMTHLIDRHLTVESLRAAVQRRIATGIHNIAPTKPPVTIVRNIELSQRTNTASPSLSTSSSSSSQTAAPTGSSALQAIKRHTADVMNCKELMDENEGPVTKSIRLTASLILRNLVIYTTSAKRSIRRFEPHLANIALSNVESSGTISHILFEMNN